MLKLENMDLLILYVTLTRRGRALRLRKFRSRTNSANYFSWTISASDEEVNIIRGLDLRR